MMLSSADMFLEAFMEDLDLEGLGGLVFRPMEDMRLNSPLRPEPFIDAGNREICLSKSHKSVVEELTDWLEILPDLEANGYSQVCDYPRAMAGLVLDIREHIEFYVDLYQHNTLLGTMVESAYIVCCRHMKSLFSKELIGGLPKIGDLFLSNITKAYSVVRESLEYLLRCHIDSKSPSPKLRLPNLKYVRSRVFRYISVTQTYFGCKHKKCTFLLNELNKSVIFLYGDSLRCLVDLIAMRQLIFLACDSSVSLREPGYPPCQDVLELLTAGDVILRALGNIAYKGLKLHEAICIGTLLTKTKSEVVSEPRAFLTVMEREFRRIIPDYFAASYLNIIKNTVIIDHLSQYYGLFRLWGHPLVDVESGLATIREVGTSFKIIDDDLVEEVLCQFKEAFAERYYDIHHTWPNCSIYNYERLKRFYESSNLKDITLNEFIALSNPAILSLKSSEVHRALTSHSPINKNSTNYRLKDWSYVSFTRTFYPESSLNPLSLLADKAACVNRSELLYHLEEKRLPASDNRRVLLAYLKQKSVNLIEKLREINEEGLSDEDLVIGLTPKEREMKLSPRMFSLMTFNFRLYITATEKLISDYIIKYLPQITMRDTGNELLQKMIKTSRLVGVKSDSINILINMDFEKWNLHQRGRFVTPIFKEIDSLLGYDHLISRTHELFEKSVFCCLDGYYFPDARKFGVEDQYSWVGHQGGIEGLRQKGWTVATSAAISLAARKAGLRAELKGSGDNQVILLEIPIKYPDQEDPLLRYHLEELAQSKYAGFMNLLEDYFNRLGLPIKKEETWSSTVLFAYGKNLYFEGRALPMSLKKICRMIHATNEAYPAFINQINGIYGAAEASSEFAYMPQVSYFIALYESLVAYKWALKWTPAQPEGLQHWRSKYSYSLIMGDNENMLTVKTNQISNTNLERDWRDWLEIMSLVNASFGGYATQPMMALLTRGFPDRVSLGITAIKRYITANVDCLSEKNKNSLLSSLCPIYKKTIDYTMLAEDPTSLNILRPIQPKNILKRGVLEFLSSDYVKNLEVKNLIEIDKTDLPTICNRMAKMTPLVPRLMSTLLDCSPSGIAQSFIGIFERTDTVQKVARKDHNLRLTCRKMMKLEPDLSRAETDAHLFFLFITSGRKTPRSDNDYEWAEILRKESWQRSDIVGVTVPHPLAYLSHQKVTKGVCNICATIIKHKVLQEEMLYEHVNIHVDNKFRLNPMISEHMSGPYFPYIGSVTFERPSTRSDVKFQRVTAPLKHAIACLRSAGWIYDLDSLFGKDIQKRIKSVTDIPLDMLITDVMKNESAILHRYRDTRLPHGGSPGTLASVFSWFNISTGTMGRYSKGQQNHPIHYQQVMSICQVLSYMMFRLDATLNTGTTALHFHVTKPELIPPLSEGKVDFPVEITSEVRDWNYRSYPDSDILYAKMSLTQPYLRPIVRFKSDFLQYNLLSTGQKRRLRDMLHSQSILRCILASSSRTSRLWAKSVSPDFIWYSYMDVASVFCNVAASLIAVITEGCGYTTLTIHGDYQLPREINLVSHFALRTMYEISEMSLSVFEALANMYYIRATRKQIASIPYMVMCPNLNPTIVETCSCAKKSILNILQLYTTKIINYPNILPFSVELVGAPITPREVNINICSTLLHHYQDDNSFDLTAFRKLRETTYRYLKEGTNAACIAYKHNYADLMKMISLEPSLKKCIKTAFKIARFQYTAELLERELRMLPMKLTTQSTLVSTLNLSPQDLSILYSANIVLAEHTYRGKTISRLVSNTAISKDNRWSFPKVSPFGFYFRPYPSVSTGYYKYLPIILQYCNIQQGQIIANLADGAGSVARICARVLKPSCVFYNSLSLSNQGYQDSEISLSCPGLDDLEESTKIIGHELLYNGLSDITEIGYVDSLLSYYPDIKFDLITCDAEANLNDESGHDMHMDSSNQLRITNALISIVEKVAHGNTVVIWKTYLTNKDYIQFVFYLFSTGFSDVKLIRSIFTSHSSTEVFFVLRGFSGSFSYPTLQQETIKSNYVLYFRESTDDQLNSLSYTHDLYKHLINLWKSSHVFFCKIVESRHIMDMNRKFVNLSTECGAVVERGGLLTSDLWTGLHFNLNCVVRNQFIPEFGGKYSYKKILTHDRGQRLIELYVFLLVTLQYGKVKNAREFNCASDYWTAVVVSNKSRLFWFCRPGGDFYQEIRKLYESSEQKDWLMIGSEHGWVRKKKAASWYQLLRVVDDLKLSPDLKSDPRLINMTDPDHYFQLKPFWKCHRSLYKLIKDSNLFLRNN